VEGGSETGVVALVLLPCALAVIMTTLGMTLRVADFRRVLVAPRGVAIGLVNLFLIAPLLAFGVAELWGLEAALAVGLVLLGASPGGTMANLLTHLARGDTALSVTMTAISSVAAVLTVPAYLELAIRHFDAAGLQEDPAMLGIVARVFLITIVPLSFGMWLRARDPQRVAALQPRLKRVALGVFVVVVAGAVVSEWDRMTESFTDVAPAALVLNVLAMSISYGAACASRLDRRQATAISLELGLHNSTLAIAVAASIDTDLAIPAAVYSAFMFLTAGAFAHAMHRRNAPAAVAEPAPA